MNSPSSLVIPIAGQLLPLVHIILACIATAVVLKKRSEMSWALVLVASLVAWLVPLLGPITVLIGLRRSRAPQA